MRQEQIDYLMKDKDIFDLTRQEFEIYFEHVTRGKLNFLMSVMKVLDEIFVKDKHGNEGLGLGLVSWFIFGVPCAVWFMFISGIIGDFIPLPHKVEKFLIYLPDAYPILCPIKFLSKKSHSIVSLCFAISKNFCVVFKPFSKHTAWVVLEKTLLILSSSK